MLSARRISAKAPAPATTRTRGIAGLGARRAAAPPRTLRRAAAAEDAGADAGPPAGCARYTVELRRPLGVVMEQRGASGGIFVVSMTPGGNAEKTGEVSVGDQLISTSGVTYSKLDDYLGVTVRKGQEIVQISALNQPFKAVSAAIGSHPASIPVRLTFQRCDPSSTVT